MDLVPLDLDGDRAAGEAAAIAATHGAAALGMRVDVVDASSVEAAAGAVGERFGAVGGGRPSFMMRFDMRTPAFSAPAPDLYAAALVQIILQRLPRSGWGSPKWRNTLLSPNHAIAEI
jgi:hypothetical protein